MNSQNTSLNAMNATVGGRVTRVEVIRDGKSTVHEMNDHNVITDAGMQFIFSPPWSQYNSQLSALNCTSIYGGAVAALGIMHVGTGTTAATVTDTGLEADVQSTSTRYWNESDGQLGRTCGTKVYISGNNYVQEELRTHQFTATSTFEMSEVGYFGKISYNYVPSSPAETMFSRVLLSTPVSVATGDLVRVTYNLKTTVSAAITTGEFGSYKYQTRLATRNCSYNNWVATSYGLIDGNYNDSAGSQDSSSLQICGNLYYAYFSFNRAHTDFAVDSNGYPSYKGLDNNWDPSENFTGSVSNWAVGQNYRDLYLTFNNVVVENFYYIRVKGWDFRFGYYDTDGTTWIDQPIVKDATHRLTLTFRTTVTRE